MCTMKILRAIGLGVVIIILKFLMFDVFSSFEETVISFFTTLRNGLDVADKGLESLKIHIP